MDTEMTYFPRQKIATSLKNKKWREECVKSIVDQAGAHDIGKGLRYSRHQKKINYELLNGRLDPSDVEEVMNPPLRLKVLLRRKNWVVLCCQKGLPLL